MLTKLAVSSGKEEDQKWFMKVHLVTLMRKPEPTTAWKIQENDFDLIW